MSAAMRPGDVLADRYRLGDLLSEARGGRFWNAWDGVLARQVALHVIAEDDDRAPLLMDAARRSATLLDPRLLRVLDADVLDGICYVVNEWGDGDSLDHLLQDGPLSPRRAAWLVSEVGALVAHAHAHGIAHGRLVPENVLVDQGGSVKVIGLAVDAALHGLPADRTATDVVDLAGVLYAALTGRWPGISRSDVPPAPQEHGRALRPRQVRAGVPRTLDALCDEVLSPHPGHGYDTAEAITAALVEYVGDPAAVAAAEAATRRANGGSRLRDRAGAPVAGAAGAAAADQQPTTVVPPVSAGASDGVESPDSPGDAPGGSGEGAVAREGEGTDEAAPEETQVAAPVFDDDGAGDLDWAVPGDRTPPPPPPPFEEPPERPLFAPDPPGGRTTRVVPAVTPTDTGTGTGSAEYWPWEASGTGSGTGTGAVPFVEDDPESDTVPGRGWLRTAAIVAFAALVLVAVVFAFDRGRDGQGPFGNGDDEPSGEASPADVEDEPVSATPIDFDPFGSAPQAENPEQLALAVDGDATTAWSTLTYQQQFGPGGLKPGVGLMLDLGGVRDVTEVDLTFTGAPTAVELRVSDAAERPTELDQLQVVDEARAGENRLTFRLDEPVQARWVLVWLTALPPVGEEFRGQVAEASVRAAVS